MKIGKLNPILQFLVIIGLAFGFLVAASYFINLFKKPDVIEKTIEVPVIIKIPECSLNYDEYLSLVKKGQSVRLIEDESMHALNGKFVNDRQITLTRGGTGEVACGYLYVRARKNGNALEEKYESIYINPQNLGGHLLDQNSIAITELTKNTTEILLPLDTIMYSRKKPFNPDTSKYKIADWAKLFNVASQTTFHIGLSAADSRAILDEVRIAYKCWNPDTGKENQKCHLSIYE